ncbi:MAG: PrsW family glutamic-type intramembrane protease [Solirubrobacteraceae bacterium]
MQMTVAAGPDAGKVVLLGAGGRLSVGRGRDCDVVLHDPKASRRHAELSAQPDGRIVLADLGSSNGTWVNGQRFDTPVSLRGDERLWVGDSVLELAPEPPPAPGGGPAGGPASGSQQQPATQSQIRRRTSQIADIALMRPPAQAAQAPSLEGTERTISRALLVGAVLLFAFLGGLTLLFIGVETGPVAFGVAVVLAFLPVPFYLALTLWVDRNEREPTWMIVLTFFWGACVAVFIALILNSVGELVVAELAGEDVGALYGFSVSAPVVEESSKALILFIIFRRFRPEFNGVLDGIVYATIVGLGFAATENVLYYGRGITEDLDDGQLFSSDDIGVSLGVFIVRGIFSPFAHPLFTAMTGIGLGIASQATKGSTRFWAPVLGLAAAMFLHSLWNTSAIFGVAFLLVYLFILVPLFVGMLFVIRGTLKRERRTIGHYLAYDVQQGALSPAELYVLTEGRLRKRALKESERVGGKPGRKLRRAFHQAASELAFLRERIARGILPWESGSAEQHQRYEAVFRDLRGRLGPLAFLPAEAFRGGAGPYAGRPQAAAAGYAAQPQYQPQPPQPQYQPQPPQPQYQPQPPQPQYQPQPAGHAATPAGYAAPPPLRMPVPQQPPLPAPAPRDWWRQ